jgi:hypothetical protein
MEWKKNRKRPANDNRRTPNGFISALKKDYFDALM